jgi:hypothetical protein
VVEALEIGLRGPRSVAGSDEPGGAGPGAGDPLDDEG